MVLIKRLGVALASAAVLSLGATLPAEAGTPNGGYEGNHAYGQHDPGQHYQHHKRHHHKCVKWVKRHGHWYKINKCRHRHHRHYEHRKYDPGNQRGHDYGGWYEVRYEWRDGKWCQTDRR